MVCLPATQFGCGFTVTFGVKFVLFLNFALNATLMAMTAGHIMFRMQGMGFASYGVESVVMAFSLAGLPIIVMAFNGVRYRNEAQVRIYLYYMWILIAVCVVLILKQFVFTGACHSMILQKEGSAFMCGIARYVQIGVTVVSLSILGYFQHVVYSHCEDLAECGGGPELGDLVLNKEAYAKRWQPDSAYSSIQGMADISDSGGLWESLVLSGGAYDGAVSSGLGGGQKLFNGRYHEMSYPPTHGSVAA